MPRAYSGLLFELLYVHASVLPKHSSPQMPSIATFSDVVTKVIDVVTNSTHTTPTRYALRFSWGEPPMQNKRN